MKSMQLLTKENVTIDSTKKILMICLNRNLLKLICNMSEFIIFRDGIFAFIPLFLFQPPHKGKKGPNKGRKRQKLWRQDNFFIMAKIRSTVHKVKLYYFYTFPCSPNPLATLLQVVALRKS